jgi:hypothetical protein
VLLFSPVPIAGSILPAKDQTMSSITSSAARNDTIGILAKMKMKNKKKDQ